MFIFQERATALGTRPQERKEICGDFHCGKPDGIAESIQVELDAVAICRDIERLHASTHRGERSCWIRVRNADKPLWLRERKWLQQNAVHQTEDGGVCSDADCEREEDRKSTRLNSSHS